MKPKQKKRLLKQHTKQEDKKTILQTPYPFLEAMKETREAKDIDEIQDMIMQLLTMYGVTTDETAALMFSVMHNTLKLPHNKKHIKDIYNLDNAELSIDDTLLIQQMLLEMYLLNQNPK